MIKIDDLDEFRPKKGYMDGGNVSLESIQSRLTAEANSIGVPVTFYHDQVKAGGLLNKTVDDCIVMHHPDHKSDYYWFCFRVQRQGNMAFVHINIGGTSKQVGKQAHAEFAKEDRKGKELSYKIGSLIGQGIRTIGMNKQKLEEEQNYYAAMHHIIDQVFAD